MRTSIRYDWNPYYLLNTKEGKIRFQCSPTRTRVEFDRADGSLSAITAPFRSFVEVVHGWVNVYVHSPNGSCVWFSWFTSEWANHGLYPSLGERLFDDEADLAQAKAYADAIAGENISERRVRVAFDWLQGDGDFFSRQEFFLWKADDGSHVHWLATGSDELARARQVYVEAVGTDDADFELVTEAEAAQEVYKDEEGPRPLWAHARSMFECFGDTLVGGNGVW